jgi:hypothetical protein
MAAAFSTMLARCAGTKRRVRIGVMLGSEF